MPSWGPRRLTRRTFTVLPEIDWREEIVEILIAGGTQGVPLNTIVLKLRQLASREQVHEELDKLIAMHKVQKFLIPKMKDGRKAPGRPLTLFRATTLILEDDHDLAKPSV